MFESSQQITGSALLIGNYTDNDARHETSSLLDELEELVQTLGLPIEEKLLIRHKENHPRFLLGSGKAEEIVALAKEKNVGALIFNHDLSPSQQRNWEELAGIPILDRQKVILDIFASRARSREARLQIELAQLEYSLPRLTRAWSHLGGQGGGIGAKGEGESQLEQDRRRMWNAMDRLKRELVQVRSARATQRKDRQRTPVPNCAIVGYTNSGKSSLLRRLTGADVLVEDRLFATLDTTTRKVSLPNNQPLLLTDTVGFVRNLPHRLVEAFKATLEEAAQADFLIHLLDVNALEVDEFHATTIQVLGELGAGTRPMILAFNKIDKITNPDVLHSLRGRYPDALFISVHTGEGLDALLLKMGDFAAPGTVTRALRVPLSESSLIARLHRAGKVHEIKYDGAHAEITVTISQRMAEELSRFVEAFEESHPPAKATTFLQTSGTEKAN